MGLVRGNLTAGLINMEPVSTETEAIDTFAAAFSTYFGDASVSGVNVNPGSLAPAETAMKSALVGLSVPSASATIIQAGITAFWSTIVGSAAVVWTVVPAIVSATPPALLSGIAAGLTSVFASNLASQLELDLAAQNVATVIHNAQTGGTALLGPPPPGGTIVPIL